MFYKSLNEKRKQSTVIFNKNKREKKQLYRRSPAYQCRKNNRIRKSLFLKHWFNYCFRQGLQMHRETSE